MGPDRERWWVSRLFFDNRIRMEGIRWRRPRLGFNRPGGLWRATRSGRPDPLGCTLKGQAARVFFDRCVNSYASSVLALRGGDTNELGPFVKAAGQPAAEMNLRV